MSSIPDERAALRKRYKLARRNVTDRTRREALIADHLAPMIPRDPTAAYIAMPGEVSLQPLFDALPDQQWALPRTGPDRKMTFHAWRTGADLISGEFNIPTPDHDAPRITHFGTILVPLVAFDDHGTRIGMGGGYYDRFLASLPREVPRIGVAFDCQHSESLLPGETWDVTLSAAVTESGVIKFAT